MAGLPKMDAARPLSGHATPAVRTSPARYRTHCGMRFACGGPQAHAAPDVAPVRPLLADSPQGTQARRLSCHTPPFSGGAPVRRGRILDVLAPASPAGDTHAHSPSSLCGGGDTAPQRQHSHFEQRRGGRAARRRPAPDSPPYRVQLAHQMLLLDFPRTVIRRRRRRDRRNRRAAPSTPPPRTAPAAPAPASHLGRCRRAEFQSLLTDSIGIAHEEILHRT